MHLFYQPDAKQHYIDDEEARHCTKVLRLNTGSTLQVTDGKGMVTIGTINKVIGGRVEFTVNEQYLVPAPGLQITMAVCPTRKAERNEWMVEKMTEVGVSKIQFVVSEHTHKETVRRVVNTERLNKIALSAMKQSQQFYLPVINICQTFSEYLAQVSESERYIAYVSDQHVSPHLIEMVSAKGTLAVLIGPEGDFSAQEIESAKRSGFVPVTLGPTRLRTETAAVAACHSAHLSGFCVS